MPRLSLWFVRQWFVRYRPKMTSFCRIGLVLAAPALLLSVAFAQDTIPSVITPLNNTGNLPYSTSIGTATEQVDLASGNLIVNIPFIQVPGRKMTYDFGIRYDARVWTLTPSTSRAGYYFYNPEMRNWLTPQTLGWTTTQGYLTFSYGKAYCVQVNGQGGQGNGTNYWAGGEQGDNYIFSDPIGLKHSLLVNQFRSGECSQSGAGTPYDSSNYVGPDSAMDGFYAAFLVPSEEPSSIQGPDGTSYGKGGSSGGASQPNKGLFFVDMGVETDLRGNTQTLSAGGVDSIGRTLVKQQSSTNLINYNVTDSTGAPQTYAVNLETIPVTTTFGGGSTIDYSGPRQVVSSVGLPNKGYYSFQYDTWGNITSIALPTGATISYKWTTVVFPKAGSVRSVSQRSVTRGGETDTWTLSYNTLQNFGNAIYNVSVADPPDPQGKKHQTNYWYDINQHLLRVQYLAVSGGAQVRQYDLTWDPTTDPRGHADSLLTSIQTTLDNGMVGLKTFQYDIYAYPYQVTNCEKNTESCWTISDSYANSPPTYFLPLAWQQGSHGNVTAIREYAYGSGKAGTLLRQTIRKYEQDSNSAYFRASPKTTGTVVGAMPLKNVVNRVASETVYDGSAACSGTGTWAGDGKGTITPPAACQANQLSQTSVVYDKGAPATYGYYGEPTSISRWLDVPTSSSLTTGYSYDGFGNIVSETDPKNNQTTYGYTDNWTGASCTTSSPTNAYLTSVTNALGRKATTSYYECTGKPASHTDQNNILTNYSYVDPLDRLTLVDSAVGSLDCCNNSAESMTQYKYPSLTEADVKQDQSVTGDGVLKSSTFYDGLNHAIKTVARDGSVVETAYDAFSRVCAVSNPTVNDPGPLSCVVGANKATATTDGYTYFSYDALGRKTLQTQPDSSTQRWVYNGNVVDFYDEDNSHWQWTSDALGRLTKTMENDPGGSGQLTLETDYTYDPLDNLLSVNQIGGSGYTARYRTFAYDSLSRLTNACNPEAVHLQSLPCTTLVTKGPWSAVYGYDANGNATTRTDGRSIVTHYTYDALNRLTGKTYTNDTAANTPALSYGYDTEYPWQLVANENNPKGHLNSIMATLGSTNLVTWTSNDYDQRGKLLGYANCLGANAQSCPGAFTTAAYGFNLIENLNAMGLIAGGATSNGQGEAIYPAYDPAGRLSSIVTSVSVDTSGNSLTSTAFSGLTYFPGGAVETANLAIDPTTQTPGISLTRTYDNRGRITGETDENSQKQSAYKYSVSYDGNGNVTTFNDSVVGNWTVKNDALHRLSSSSGTINSVAASFQEAYDPFGNHNVEHYTYKGVQNQPSPYLHFTAGNNRIDNGSYDDAGNLLSDGLNNYLYDAENRLCAVQQASTGGGMIGYLYAPDGTRLGKGTLTSFTCDMTKNGMLKANGLALTTLYTVGPDGEQLEEVGTANNYNYSHFNVFWEGKLLGTYTGSTYAESNWHFALNDWLGTKRQITTSAGVPSTSFFSGPFGDYQTPSASDPSEQHFTGKERDTESNLDYFPARYYNSSMGRFMSPDWSKNPQGVPYADFTNPQTLNLYSYVKNNPLSLTDPDGHCWSGFQLACNVGQSFGNLFSGLGFHTDQTVENNLQNANQYLRQHGVSTEGMRDAAILKTFQTYTKNNPDTGQTYSGRTSGTRSPEENVMLRDRSHHMNEEGYGPANVDKSSTNPAAIRGREQQLIDANGGAQSQGGTSGNAINGVSPTNPNKPVYCTACESEFPVEPVGPVEPIEPIEIPF